MSRRIIYLILTILLLILLAILVWYFFFRDNNNGNNPPDNNPPTAVNDTFSTTPSTAVSDNVLTNDSDPDGDALTANEAPITAPGNGSLTLAADGSFTYTPNDDFLGDDSFRYEVCDPANACAEADVTITIVVPVPLPVANDDTAETTQGTAVSGNVLTNDTPEGGLTLNTTPTTAPAHGEVVLQTNGDFTYTPAAGFVGTDTFTYEACDAVPACGTAVATITVNSTGPDAIDDEFTMAVNTAVTGNVLTNDTHPNGDTLTVDTTPVTAPTNGTVVLQANGDFTYTPETDFAGSDSFRYKVCDTAPLCSEADVAIQVGPGPNAVDDTFITAVNTAVSDNVVTNDTHPDNKTLTVDTTPVTTPTNGTLDLQANGDFTYTPATDFAGSDGFRYKVCDDASLCDEADVTIDVMVDPPPTTVNDEGETALNTELKGNVLDNDSDPGGLDLALTTTPVEDVDHGTVTLSENGDFTYMPDTDFTGEDQFTYEVCNSNDKCSQAVVTITVQPMPTTAEHTVRRGEWLLQIARCYGTTVYAIRMANYIPYPNLIYPDQVLKIPEIGSAGPYSGPPCIDTHTVEAGDTTAGIAQQFGIKESELKRLNGIPYPNGFYVGQFIVIPRPIPDYMLP